MDKEDIKEYGDVLKKEKEDTVLRIVIQNANNLPAYKQYDKKTTIKIYLGNYFDFWMLSEIGLNWKK